VRRRYINCLAKTCLPTWNSRYFVGDHHADLSGICYDLQAEPESKLNFLTTMCGINYRKRGRVGHDFLQPAQNVGYA
jgi:hypothetical protein